MHDPDRIEELIDRSSFGTPTAKGLRARTPTDVVQRIVDRANRLNQRFAVGFELLPYRLVAMVTDETGNRMGVAKQQLRDMDPTTVVLAVAKMTRDIVETNLDLDLPDERLALGMQLGGPVDTKTGRVFYLHKRERDPEISSRSPEAEFKWEDEPLGSHLEQATGLKTFVENDANAFAVYEQWFGEDPPVERLAVLLIREGVGGSLVINNELFDGPVEIGNIVVYPGGRLCDCGNTGCLEVTAGTYGIAANATELTGHVIEGVAAAAELAEQPGDVGFKASMAFSAAGIAIARGIGYLLTIANPDRVVLYGPGVMFAPERPAADAFLAEAKRFKDYVPFKAFRHCEFVTKPLGDYEGSHGAALLALQRCFGIRPPAKAARLVGSNSTSEHADFQHVR
jgi:predicted NBD/HSP70 family sugar kinase